MINRATLRRNQKLLMEKSIPAAEAAALIAASAVNIVVDDAASSSRVGQIAVLVAAATASRAFGRVGFIGPDVPLLVRGATSSLRQEVARCGAAVGEVGGPTIFVTTETPRCGLDDIRVTLDRGVGGFVPADVPATFDLDGFAPAALLGASLAVTSVFGRHVLKEPDDGRSRAFDMLPSGYTGPVADLDRALPAHLAFLGIGHLGQGALFCASLLGGLDDRRHYDLLDDQEIDPANFSTQLLVAEGQVGLKTTACVSWLVARGIESVPTDGRLVAGVRASAPPAPIYLAGFDQGEARRALDVLLPAVVIEMGIGGRVADFTAFRIHLFPQSRLPSEIFHELAEDLETLRARAQEESAFEKSAFGDREATTEERCGMIEAAGAASGAPFVGTAVAAIALSQVIRIAAGLLRDDVVAGDLRTSGVGDAFVSSPAG